MSATLNVVVSINSTTVMQTYWTIPFKIPCLHQAKYDKNTELKTYFEKLMGKDLNTVLQ